MSASNGVTMRQLALDGREVPYPQRVYPLTSRQRQVLLYMRQRRDVRPVDVGRLMHASRDVEPCAYTPFQPGACCEYAASDGWDALHRLEKRGLVERVGRGQWRLVIVDESEWVVRWR